LETVVTARRDKAAALKFLKRIMKKYGRRQERRDRWALLLRRGHERHRHRRSTRSWRSAQQSGGEFPSTISTAGAGDAAVSQHEDPAEIQFNSRQVHNHFNQERHLITSVVLQTQTFGRAWPSGALSLA